MAKVEFLDTPLFRWVAERIEASILGKGNNVMGMGGKCPECGWDLMFNHKLIGCASYKRTCNWHDTLEHYAEELKKADQISSPAK